MKYLNHHRDQILAYSTENVNIQNGINLPTKGAETVSEIDKELSISDSTEKNDQTKKKEKPRISPKVGDVCFIDDRFFKIHDRGQKLMQNKDTTKRPVVVVFRDRKYKHICWCVPVSSDIDKYQKLRDHKAAQNAARGNAAECNTIVIGKLGEDKSAFLPQNLFPVHEKFVSALYIKHGEPVTVEPKLLQDITQTSYGLVSGAMRGLRTPLFTDVRSMLYGQLPHYKTNKQEQQKPTPKQKNEIADVLKPDRRKIEIQPAKAESDHAERSTRETKQITHREDKSRESGAARSKPKRDRGER